MGKSRSKSRSRSPQPRRVDRDRETYNAQRHQRTQRRRSRSKSREPEHRREIRDDTRRYNRGDRKRNDRSRSPADRSRIRRSPKRRRSRSPPRRRRTRSRSKDREVKGGAVPKFLMKRPEITEKDLEGKTEEEQDMMKMMGFGGFDTTKGKHVPGNDVSAVHVVHKRKYRQYMNRKGGFNRPLDFVA